MNSYRKSAVPVLCLILSLFLLSSCNRQDASSTSKNVTIVNTENPKDYLALIISFDTLAAANVKKIIYQEDRLLSQQPSRDQNPYFHYFRARKFNLEKKRDSAVAEFELMKGGQTPNEVELLKKFQTLDLAMGNGAMVESTVMKRVFSAIEEAERLKSKLTYRFYDLLARAYYQNQNEENSLAYAALYFKNHPYKSHSVIQQRYFDISFLLAYRLRNFKKMAYYNSQARILAQKVGDSLAIARTYDNEAQIYSAQMQHAKALVCSKIYFNYLKKTNNLNDVAFNNLATAFNLNKQPDSAIYYYKEGIALERKEASGKQKTVYYLGLIDAYKMKGDLVKALQAADSAHRIEIRNNKAIEAVKVAEMHEQYETENKDQNIQQLKSRNQLNETIIKQQRWTIFLSLLVFIGVLSFLYGFYRQQRLKEKNKLLKSDVDRLNMEQKMLQSQLNPHFIFNAIANLQSLIASGHTDESVSYLKSFSGLLRGVLEQNRKDFIEIEEEITSLENYIQLQQMRYAGAFDYKITVDDQLDQNEILIPPMLIQPFVENAIEHGFRNIAYKGLLTISFRLEDNSLMIEIDDNGSGLTKMETDKQKKQSLAQIILKERFDLLFTSRRQKAHFKVADNIGPDAKGVRVEITIPIINE
ncbi:histidine kinase [Pedobacter sp. PACM 27299]|uniref:sensor histidine kinase n=1 Tax=Pedobacter sp. PACM 27299 TaxID=1727164 RepID=UPI0007065889|nr:histidine kinase [Pedobacter sp. PACM 27299]ALL05723.1 histidine kinase [Pedobacter sp. PACM 27299]